MKKFKVFYSQKAADDLDDIFSYIAYEKNSEENAKRLIKKLITAVSDLSFMADSYHFYQKEPYLTEGVRYFSEGKYSIFYKIQTDKAIVLRIVYGARDLEKMIVE